MPEQRSSAFISYSHKDKSALEMLKQHLKYLEEKYQLRIWDDQRIAPGAKWRNEIQAELATAKVAILLVSADFLASAFIMQEELPLLLRAAQEGSITLLSIVLRPCLFEETPLVQFQAFTQPLSAMTKARREATLGQIAKAITAALQTAEATNP